jgi:hypothetical protein
VGADKTLQRVLNGTADAAIRFDELCSLQRINLQRDGNNAKPYQVKQARAVILKYRLGAFDE